MGERIRLKMWLSTFYNLVGIAVGVLLLWNIWPHFFQMLDRAWTRATIETKAQLVSFDQERSFRTRRYWVRLQTPSSSTHPAHLFRVDNSKLYDHLKKQYNPPYALRVTVTIGKRWLTSTPVLVEAGPVRLPTKFKPSRLVLFFILVAVGGAIIFAATREIHKKWRDARHQQWIQRNKKPTATPPEEDTNS